MARSGKLARWLEDSTDSWLDNSTWGQTDWSSTNNVTSGSSFQQLLDQLNTSQPQIDSRWTPSSQSGSWSQWSQSSQWSQWSQWHHHWHSVDHPGTLTVTSDSPDGFVSGATVTANVSDPEGFKSGTFQWSVFEDGQWKVIDGVTSASLTLTTDQVGKQIDVTCTYTDNAGHTTTIADPFTVTAPSPEPQPPAPTPDQPGTLEVNSDSGAFSSGATVTAIVNDADTVAQATYEWFVVENGQSQKIDGVTTPTLHLDDSEAGKTLEVKVTYTDGA